ncbi:helix-turn-helix domain-containing protein [Desulfatiferula olefinivorans]
MDHQPEPTTGAGLSEMSFGAYLKKARLDKGLSIEDIMDHTRISKFVIQQIEAENREKLPEDVFLKGFLKAYAEAVEVDPFDVLERYRAARGVNEAQGAVPARDKTSLPSNAPVKMIAAVAIILILSVLIMVVAAVRKTEPPDAGSRVVTTADETRTSEPARTTERAPGEATVPPAAGLHLEVVCVEDTTLKIITDGGAPEEYRLKPEDHVELNADQGYTILIDNTCGVTLFLNNTPVTVPGKCGQTATIQLP